MNKNLISLVICIELCGLLALGDQTGSKVAFHASGRANFESLIQLALQEKLPFGIVIDKNDKKLCEVRPQPEFPETSISEILGGLLSDMNAKWLDQSGVVVIRLRKSSNAQQTFQICISRASAP